MNAAPTSAVPLLPRYRLILAAIVVLTLVLEGSPARNMSGGPSGRLEAWAFSLCLTSALLSAVRPLRAFVLTLAASIFLLASLEAFDLWAFYFVLPAALPVVAQAWHHYRLWLSAEFVGIAGQLLGLCALLVSLRRELNTGGASPGR